MARVHLVEIEDQSWCPELLRDATTGLLELFLRVGNHYAAIVPRLVDALRAARATEVIDLCSGGGGPWPSLLSQLGSDGPHQVVLTDKFPNVAAAEQLSRASGGRIRMEARSIDARHVPDDLQGFRTLFTSLHHFRPSDAQAILGDAFSRKVGIGAFEFTERSPAALFAFLFTPLAVLISLPFVRPFRWSWFVLTYVVPVIPLMALFDGVVSCLRTYSPAELRNLVETLRSDEYIWEIGQQRIWWSPVPVTYLLGYPVARPQRVGSMNSSGNGAGSGSNHD